MPEDKHAENKRHERYERTYAKHHVFFRDGKKAPAAFAFGFYFVALFCAYDFFIIFVHFPLQ